MNIIERAQRLLVRRGTNSPKVAALFFIHAVGWFALDAAGFDDLASPWVGLTLVPPALIYFAERLGKIRWFAGMTLPSLFVMAGSVALISAIGPSDGMITSSRRKGRGIAATPVPGEAAA